ncbi:helix-turn-helix transcriptional regulator [Campylobacter sp. FMV-PI01]|uniref:Helix-turn-helix transcriptional regulator n=1 Tax=Campylobacter portucalensis TaxID=2608384 RepID=A0A6L5WI61_9BACT|nr:AraC family transcriptional regulator [Campylobacter portucalensis]MSN96809.1 helix-turn-helix transcriptional regulator [Campylobacter portucalensis]
MSKIIRNYEFLENLKEKNLIKIDGLKKSFSYQDRNFKMKMSVYDLQNGILYRTTNILLNEDITFIKNFADNCHFLHFNTLNSSSVCPINGKRAILNTNQVWTGSIIKDFKGKMDFLGNTHQIQSIILNDNLIKEFNVFNHLNPLNDYFHIKSSNISKFQNQILNELRNADIYSGKLKELFIESKVLELLFITFSNLSINDNKTAQRAKELLLKDLSSPPSIKELAKACTTNEVSLQESFKKQFKNTIYGYLKDERLKVAFELLKRKDVNVSEAAKIVGYNSLSHFTKIFKDKYGVLPSNIAK